LKICGDIRKSRCTTGINDTSGIFATNFASVVDAGGKFSNGVNDTGGIFAAFVNDTGGNLPLVSTTPAANYGNNTVLGCRDLTVNLKTKMYL
jgi:hypothetical protein